MIKSTEKISRENFTWLFEQPLDVKVSILQQHLSICQLVINQILEEEVKYLSGERYSQKAIIQRCTWHKAELQKSNSGSAVI